MGIKVFWLEPVAEIERELRRYASFGGTNDGDTPPCERTGWGYHNAAVVIGREAKPLPPKEARYEAHGPDKEDYAGDPRWPTKCDHCNYVFRETDDRQVNDHRLYEVVSEHPLKGQRFTLQKAPPGAMWDAWWMHHGDHDPRNSPWTGPDGIALIVRLPNGSDWHVDGQASNCTRDQWGAKPGEPNSRYWLGRTHFCWVRHGDPRTGQLHVDKNGETCAAGAGSILSGTYHGFLHNGELTT